ncbi:MAG: S8 family serine peptidase, partial [Melioribacteraceae bacterium]|nr:S8 family serine peptidase [Melioribacteraceae bacterium]
MKRFFGGIITCTVLITTCMSNKAFAIIDETKQIIVVFESDLSNKEMDETVVDVGGKVTEAYEEVNVAKVEVTAQSIVELKKDPLVKYVEEDIIIKQSAQMEDYGIQTTKIPKAWNSGYTGRGVKIAVVDSGIALHNDLFISGGVSTVDYTSSYIDDQGHGTHVAGIIGA